MVRINGKIRDATKPIQEHGNSGVPFFNNFPNLRCLPASKVEINNEKLNKVKISNLKVVRELNVITEEEFRLGV
jgi:hypothetical protein